MRKDSHHSDSSLESSLTPQQQQEQIDRLLEELSQPGVEIETLVTAIASVPGLSEELLHSANSPEFALRSQILRVQHAIAYLGLNRVTTTIEKFHERRKPFARKPHMLRESQQTSEGSP